MIAVDVDQDPSPSAGDEGRQGHPDAGGHLGRLAGEQLPGEGTRDGRDDPALLDRGVVNKEFGAHEMPFVLVFGLQRRADGVALSEGCGAQPVVSGPDLAWGK